MPQITFRPGRLAPHDRAVRPRIALRDLLGGSYPPAPTVVDYISKVTEWPMYGNDTIGDCTIAAVGHMIEAWTAYGQGNTVEITEADVLKGYEAVSGYKPGNPATDQGANMQDVLDYLRKTGIGGHKILAFAEVDIHNDAELAAAMALFGHLYIGVNLPDSAMNQFNAGQPWDVMDEDGGNDGGHAICAGYVAVGGNYKAITWGAVQEMTRAWFGKYVEEVWVVVSAEWLAANRKNPEGIDESVLGEAFEAITGEPSPFPPAPVPVPAPTPSPVPTPVPAPPADPDADLVAALDPWAAEHHTGANAAAARAFVNWRSHKGL